MEFGRFVGSSSDSASELKGKGTKAMAKVKAKAEAEKDLIRRVGEIYCYECSGVDVSLSLGLGPLNPSCQGIPDKGLVQKPESIARFCRSCGATETPLWRKGPMGTKTLCNACGLRYWKEERTVSSKLTLGLPTPKQVKKW